ncbi:hypothetical protein ABZW18_31905 [Streptomyces sp. NPDC004647]|uniref:hypothetical protein n=1 Tax=Streptomyces sp. NPDC004647 TaxID=3154671 RepID=UPI0033BD99A5
MSITRKTVTGLVAGGVVAASLFAGTSANAAKREHVLDDSSSTPRVIVLSADTASDKVYSVAGIYTTPQAGPYYMRKMLQKPGETAKPWGGWEKAKRDSIPDHFGYPNRIEWKLASNGVKLPNGTRISVQIKGSGSTPAFKI